MKMDESVYVGGLPYNTTEHSLRRAFTFYGHVISVKINNEGVGGKCYGFVTFTNPRSAVDAIKDMNGRTIGGRVVRVNEVKAKGGRENINRESFRRNFERSLSERGRDRDREYAHYEDRNRAHKRDRSQDPGQNRDRERGIVPENNYDQARDHSLDRDRERSARRSIEEDNRETEWEQGNDLDQYRDREVKRSTRHLNSGNDDNDQESNKLNGSHFNDIPTREHSSESRDNDYEVEKELKDANQYLEELHNQVSQVEELVDEKQQLVSELQAEAQKLEDSLRAAKKVSSQRQIQLAKLSRCYLQMKNYDKKLKSSEQELQSLVDTAMVDVDDSDDFQSDNNALTYRF